MEDRIATLERAAESLQQQINDLNIRYTALRAAVANLVPDLLAGHGVTPAALDADKERLMSTAHWTTLLGVTPKESDQATDAIAEEINSLYGALAKNLAAVLAAKAPTAAMAAHDPMAEAIASAGVKLSDDQLGLVAFLMRREVAAAIDSETRALLNLCEREARWTADSFTAKLVLQRIESFARSRLDPPRPSFFDAFQ